MKKTFLVLMLVLIGFISFRSQAGNASFPWTRYQQQFFYNIPQPYLANHYLNSCQRVQWQPVVGNVCGIQWVQDWWTHSYYPQNVCGLRTWYQYSIVNVCPSAPVYYRNSYPQRRYYQNFNPHHYPHPYPYNQRPRRRY